MDLILGYLAKLKDQKNKIIEENNWQNNQEKKKIQEQIDFLENHISEITSLQELAQNPDFHEEAQNEILLIEQKIKNFIIYTLMDKKYLDNEFFMEIKTGVGGLDSQQWSLMLFKMYTKYFSDHDIPYKIIDREDTDAGIKNIILEVLWPMYKMLGEAGIHRLVRISPFNAQGKRQTSFSAVFLYKKTKEQKIQINQNELKIDTFRASGAGGQHVNKTESAVRITHIPTGIIVTCQSERSQQQNKETAISLLISKIVQKQKSEDNTQVLDKEEVTWGQQFRSYILDPYKTIKDNRLEIEIKSNVEVNKVIAGDIQKFINAFEQQKIDSLLREFLNI